MNSINKIIVPVDFSEFSECAIKLALIYAKTFNSDIQLVHVLNKNSSRYAITEKKEKEISTKNLEQLLEKFSPQIHEGGELEYIIKTGRIYEEVARQAEAYSDSFVITATHGNSGWNDAFIGSNAYRIVESTIRPVISIKTCENIKVPKKIVMPIDISKETREKLPLVTSIAKAFNSKVHILKVTTSNSRGIHNKLKMYSAQASRYFDEYGIEHDRNIIVGDNITNTTIDYAKSVDADMIAIMTEQTKSLTNLLLGSYAHQMLNNSPVPVLNITPYELTVRGSSFTSTGGK